MNEEDLKIIEFLKQKAVKAQMFGVVMELRQAQKQLKQSLARLKG